MQWWVWLIIAFVGVVLLCTIMHYINKHYRIKYDMNLFGGGLLMLIAFAAFGFGIYLALQSNVIGYALLGLGGVITLITLIYDCKKCGWAGVPAVFFQLIFSVACLLLIIELMSNKGHSTTRLESYRETRDVRARREAYRNGRDYD